MPAAAILFDQAFGCLRCTSGCIKVAHVGLSMQAVVPNPLDGLKKSADAAKKAAPQAVQVPLPACCGLCMCSHVPGSA